MEKTHYRICFNGISVWIDIHVLGVDTLWWNIIPEVEDLRFNSVYKE